MTPLYRVEHLHGTAADWVAYNPVLMRGEIGIEATPGQPVRMKIGDGKTPWVNLPYFGPAETSDPGDPIDHPTVISTEEPYTLSADDEKRLVLVREGAPVTLPPQALGSFSMTHPLRVAAADARIIVAAGNSTVRINEVAGATLEVPSFSILTLLPFGASSWLASYAPALVPLP